MENNNGSNVLKQNNESAGGFKKFMIRLGIVLSWPIFQVVRPAHKFLAHPYSSFKRTRQEGKLVTIGLFICFFPVSLLYALCLMVIKSLISFAKAPFKTCILIRAVGSKSEYWVTHKYKDVGSGIGQKRAKEDFNGSFKQTIGILSGVYGIKRKPKLATEREVNMITTQRVDEIGLHPEQNYRDWSELPYMRV